MNEHTYQSETSDIIMTSKYTGLTQSLLQDASLDVDCANTFKQIVYKLNIKFVEKQHSLDQPDSNQYNVFKPRVEEGYSLYQGLKYLPIWHVYMTSGQFN